MWTWSQFIANFQKSYFFYWKVGSAKVVGVKVVFRTEILRFVLNYLGILLIQPVGHQHHVFLFNRLFLFVPPNKNNNNRYVVSTLLQRSIASLIRWHERNCHERRMTENSRLLALNSHSVPPQPFPTTSMQSSIIATPPPTLAEVCCLFVWEFAFACCCACAEY